MLGGQVWCVNRKYFFSGLTGKERQEGVQSKNTLFRIEEKITKYI